MKDFSTLGARIRALRGTRSQAEYASIFGVDRTTLGSWENNQYTPAVHLLVMMAKLGGVSLDWLCSNEDNISYDDELTAASSRWKKVVFLAVERKIDPSVIKSFVMKMDSYS